MAWQLTGLVGNGSVGALVVFASFIMLNALELHERSVEAAAIQKRKEDANLFIDRNLSNNMPEASLYDTTTGLLVN